jgi:hypothetical protein
MLKFQSVRKCSSTEFCGQIDVSEIVARTKYLTLLSTSPPTHAVAWALRDIGVRNLWRTFRLITNQNCLSLVSLICSYSKTILMQILSYFYMDVMEFSLPVAIYTFSFQFIVVPLALHIHACLTCI